MDQFKTFTDYLGITQKQPEKISWCLNIINCSQNIITWIKENPWTCVFLVILSGFLFWFCTKYSVNVTKKKKPKINKTENFTRSVVEKMFNQQFPSIRPDWLNNSESGRNLEIDMYNEKLKLGFEYNGEQHYKYNKFFHNTIEDFEKQKEHDAKKHEICKNNGITLISIPYTIKKQDIKNYIIKECERKNIKIPNKN